MQVLNHSHVTHSESKHAPQTPSQTERSLLLPVQVENNSNDQGSVPGAAVALNDHSLILKNSQCITLSDMGQHSTSMTCYFHSKQNSFLDYFNESLPDGAVIYVGDIPFWYSEKEGMFAEVLDNMTGNIFLATSRNHKFLLSYKNTTLHTSAKYRRSSYNCLKNPSSITSTHMLLLPSNPSDPLHSTHYE